MTAFAESLARACHELRGPLHAAGLALHAAARETPAAAARLRAVEAELGRVAAVVEDLDVLRGVGRRPAVPGSVACPHPTCPDVAALVATQILTWSALADHHGRALARGPLADGLAVDVDPRRLAQATGNLVANALEHGAGPVRVSVLRRGAGAVRIEVTDEGPGLPAPIAALVAGARDGRGSRGRGLAIATGIAAGAGGRLAALPSSTGARFALDLPLVVASAAPAPA